MTLHQGYREAPISLIATIELFPSYILNIILLCVSIFPIVLYLQVQRMAERSTPQIACLGKLAEHKKDQGREKTHNVLHADSATIVEVVEAQLLCSDIDDICLVSLLLLMQVHWLLNGCNRETKEPVDLSHPTEQAPLCWDTLLIESSQRCEMCSD